MRARLAQVMLGRPRLQSAPEVQAVISDLVAREVADTEPGAAEIRAIQAEAAKPRRTRR